MRFAIACLVSLMLMPACCCASGQEGSWLDQAKPATWNQPGMSIPAAPESQGNADPRCRKQARPPPLSEDKRLHERGWELIGAYQGGWNVLVIAAAASYDGMCRPLQYQYFAFVRGVFAGTLSPRLMDSRTDGALSRVSFESGSRLNVQYLRYALTDALCCASRTTSVIFEISGDKPVIQPTLVTTSLNR